MSTLISSAVWQRSEAKATGLLVLLSLADQANDEGWCWPSVETIAKRCRISVRTVQRFLGELEAIGEVTREERPGTSTRYHISVTPDNLSPRQSVRGDTAVTEGVTLLSPRNVSESSTTELSLRSSSAQKTSRDLVGEWIDHCNGERPPGRVVGQISKEIGAMLREGIPYDDVRTGLQQWQLRGLHPSALASVVHEMRTAHSGGLKSRRQLETDSQFERMFARAKQLDQEHADPKEIEQ